jgi:plasmid stabilization system protein ParE
MRYAVRYTSQAFADISRNAHWWAQNHSVEQALKWEAAVELQIQSLEQMPERYGLAPENPDFAFELRQQPIGLGPRPGYRAVYTVQGATVYILAVRSGAQDLLSPVEVDFPGE